MSGSLFVAKGSRAKQDLGNPTVSRLHLEVLDTLVRNLFRLKSICLQGIRKQFVNSLTFGIWTLFLRVLLISTLIIRKEVLRSEVWK